MAHPKRKQSKTRTAKRRTHDKAVAPTLALCPNCGAWHIYHTVCGECGYYRGKVAIEKAEMVYPPSAPARGPASRLNTRATSSRPQDNDGKNIH